MLTGKSSLLAFNLPSSRRNLVLTMSLFSWGVIPCVRAAQREDVVFVPEALQMPWLKMQKHFGLECQSGNIMSNIVLNFDREGNHMLKINQGLPEYITSTEEAFSRILYEVEVFVSLLFPSRCLEYYTITTA